MKRTIYLIMMIACVCAGLTSCYDREVLDEKEGVSLPTVTNLQYSISGNTVTLTWSIPTDIPSEVARPLSVNIQVLRYHPGVLSPTRLDNRTLGDEAVSTTFTMPTDDSSIGYEYHAVVKLTGNLKEVVKGYSSSLYSLGQTVIIK